MYRERERYIYIYMYIYIYIYIYVYVYIYIYIERESVLLIVDRALICKTATHCNTLRLTATGFLTGCTTYTTAKHCNTLQYTATHCHVL